MAFRLSNSHLRIIKLEKLLCKINRKQGSYSSNFCTLSEANYVANINQLHGFLPFNSSSCFKRRCRFIHSSSPLCGKVVPYTLSDIGEGIVEVVIKEWLIKVGDTISQFDPICEVQSDKASVTITSRYDGKVTKLCYQVDDTAKVGEPLINIELLEDAADEGDSKKAEILDTAEKKCNKLEDSRNDKVELLSDRKVLAAPTVRRFARENNVDLQKVTGSGRFGQVLKEDVISYMSTLAGAKPGGTLPSPGTICPPPPPSSRIPSPSPPPVTMSPSSFGQDLVLEVKGIKKAMVKSMVASWSIPLFSYCDEVDVGVLVSLKDELTRLSQSKGVKITLMPFFIKAASLALNKYPIINSAPDANCDIITIKSAHNIGIAIDTPHGLVVPNIKNVQTLGVIEIARKLNRLQDIAAKGQLGLEDLSGGTMTLSNIGMIGGTYTKPLLLPPQVIIGGIGKVQVLPRFDKDKNVVEAHLFKISWTADHRVLDGATVARFSNLWKLYIEHPQLLLNL